MTIIFQATSAISTPNSPVHRTGSWTESWYLNGNSIPSAISMAIQGPAGGANLGIVPLRASLLGLGASIIGVRFQVVDPRGPSQVIAVNYVGTATLKQDIPQMALLVRCPSIGAANVRRFTLRGIPDQYVTEGEYTPDLGFTTAFLSYVAQLTNWVFPGRDLSITPVEILAIDNTGKVTCWGNHGYNVNDKVRILRTMDAKHKLQGGLFQVSGTGPTAIEFTVRNWVLGATTGGHVRKENKAYLQPDVANTSVSRVVTRRVGRPFAGYRGRQSKQVT